MLTRESIRSGAVRRIAAEQGLMRILSDEELTASLGGLLHGADLSTGVWVFAYGSLIWNPAFHFTDRVVGRVFGFHRRFCLWTHLGRGCPERPGLTLGLERGGSCLGVAYHIAADAALEELDIVWRREMLGDAYVPRWVAVRTPLATVRAITFTINRAHERYVRDLSDEAAAAAIARASGFLGPCADYLINTVDHLAALGIHDRPLERLRDRVLARAAAPPQADQAT
ncbi:MAG TPA: gamma-glutamylcyclotransferase [Geminicoccaceae bacterium]|nr:gamma-glutamylcyclotransferase [Geminicoccaceae bacterium]